MPPRRNQPASTSARASPNVAFREASLILSSDPLYTENIQTLRRCWQWAACGQFFYTFAQLLQMPDVALSDVEDDLARGTDVYLPRIMLRLLLTMSQDRKLTLDNWQTAFRKQCMKRGGQYNPLGPEPVVPEEDLYSPVNEASDSNIDVKAEADNASAVPEPEPDDADEPDAPGTAITSVAENQTEEGIKEEHEGQSEGQRLLEDPDGKGDCSVESKTWADLSMKQKLVALHMLTEWQFDNPIRLRQQMKDDGDSGHWRIEPIGYDAKTNAYWLIGADRLWIQRALPKPPRVTKRKRAPPAKKTKSKASTSRVVEPDSDSEPEPELEQKKSVKRTRTATGRASRGKPVAEGSSPSGRGARAAKLQANKKLDAQAKELAEFQRQAALLSSPSKSLSRPTRATRASTRVEVQASPSSKRLTLGTRASARLRGSGRDSDDEWQQIPDEWLANGGTASPPAAGRRTRSKGKAKANHEQEEGEVQSTDEITHAGLGSDDAISELTELSDDSQDDMADHGDSLTTKPPEPEPPVSSKAKKSGKSALEKSMEDPHKHTPSVDIPKDFIEWETICVTLPEWEAMSDRFAGATHYSEKALHKVLSQSIAPIIVAELREAERKRKVEEAVVHRKRSSRIALKETEKEEARLAALHRAEEQEKLARARRQEARAKKEEAEREKREQAREQRRLEREARERKIQNRNEPKEQSTGPSSAHSTPVPVAEPRGLSLNGVHIPTPLQMNRSTHNNVRSNDWVLDCEICGKGGINVKDTSPMVSCGICGRWQHIDCHDIADRNAGYAKRNWNTHQFICQGCRAVQPQRIGNGSQNRHNVRAPPVDGWPQPHSQKTILQPSHAYSHPPPDMRYSQQPPYDHPMGYGQQPYPMQSATDAAMYSRGVQRHSQGFSPYQPDRLGFPSSTPAPPLGWSNGHSPIDGRRLPDQGIYNSARAGSSFAVGRQTAPYQASIQSPASQNGPLIPSQSYERLHDNHSFSRAPDVQEYVQAPETQTLHRPLDTHYTRAVQPYPSNGSWHHTPASAFGLGQRSASHISAAESLAYMQESTPNLPVWQGTSHVHMNGGLHSNPSPTMMHHNSAMSNGRGSSYQFPAS